MLISNLQEGWKRHKTKNGVWHSPYGTTFYERHCVACRKIGLLARKEAKYCSHPCYLKNRERFGENNSNWKGRRKNPEGYIMVYSPGHPNCQPGIKGYILEHRLIMSKHIKRPLTDEEIVHHINGIKDDNRVENLVVTTSPIHTSHHKPWQFHKAHKH
jgi:hypothetical protein